MKKIKEEIINEYFVCESCNEKYISENSALFCERRHNCKHENVTFVYYYNQYGQDHPEITKKCIDCSTEWTRIIDEVPDAVAEKIFKYLESRE